MGVDVCVWRARVGLYDAARSSRCTAYRPTGSLFSFGYYIILFAIFKLRHDVWQRVAAAGGLTSIIELTIIWFSAASIIHALLVIGGVEVNPGPQPLELNRRRKHPPDVLRQLPELESRHQCRVRAHPFYLPFAAPRFAISAAASTYEMAPGEVWS